MNNPLLSFHFRFSTAAFVSAVCLTGIFGAVLPPVRADQALVVGINEYPKLDKGRWLQGAVNDADAMKQALNQNGFSVILLQNETATKSDIVAAFQKIVQTIKPGERFVFYFAGHGNNKPRCLVPYDATPTADNVLTKDELTKLVASVPGASRVVILDACFSGGMIGKSDDLSKSNRRSRFAGIGDQSGSDGGKSDDVLDGSVDVIPADPAPAAPKTPVNAPATATRIVYVAAALESEKAIEGDYNGKPHGTFTNFLLPHTTPTAASKETLGKAMNDVKGKVVDDSADLQTPRFSPGFESTPLFGAGGTPGGAADHGGSTSPAVLTDGEKAKTVWDVYTQDAPNTDVLQLFISPNQPKLPPNQIKPSPKQTTFLQKDIVTLSGVAKHGGYLVLLDRDQQNHLSILFPQKTRDPRTSDNYVAKDGRAFTFDIKFSDWGTERFKAVLFETKEEADAVVATFGVEGFDFKGARTAELIGGGVINYTTAQVVYQVTPANPAAADVLAGGTKETAKTTETGSGKP